MKKETIILMLALCIAAAAPVAALAAPDASTVALDASAGHGAAEATVPKWDGGTPPPVPVPGVSVVVPQDGAGAIATVVAIWKAVKGRAWWFVAAASVFLIMFVVRLFGLFERLGKRWTWILTGVLSFAAATMLAFDANGFSWAAFVTYCTAGPTVAWLRGFVKKAVVIKEGE